MKPEIKITEDGSKTLFVPELNEHYHSTFGAVQESMHVYINMGLQQINKRNIRIFELGYGTGLNTLLTFLNKSKFENIEYHGMELYPIDAKLFDQLGYEKFLKLSPDDREIVKLIHNSSWNTLIEISPGFLLNKINASILEFNQIGSFDLVYFDAFAPTVQPELWTENVFLKIFNSMNKEAILVTYCAKGEVRRTMLKIGFEVERLPGPPGKFEMIRAIKS
jgi:tRNA U34 5-methylaminomethyl-2-thiouridine-forming methyltransferase MnmC